MKLNIYMNNAVYLNDRKAMTCEASVRSLLETDHNYIVTHTDITGAVACIAIRHSPYDIPNNLELVIRELYTILRDDIKADNGRWVTLTGLHLRYFRFRELESYLEKCLTQIPEFVKWNEKKNKGRVITEGDPDNDFIDLDAFYRTVTSLILTDAEDNRSFDENYDLRYK